MTGEELKQLQTTLGWKNKDLARILNEALDRKYTDDMVTKWRGGKAGIPKRVAAFLSSLDEPAIEDGTADVDLVGIGEDEHAREDTAPAGRGEGKRPSLTLVTGTAGAYTRICEEFFELIATAVGMVGAAVGSESVRRDGQIILADKAELGRAWGKLAEQNETFARLLTATDKQGAYLAVALATGTTVGKIWQNHQPPRLQMPPAETPPAADANVPLPPSV